MDEDEVKDATRKHILDVNEILGFVIKQLVMRGVQHDHSKLEDEELPIFVKYTPKLRDTTYGSDEYKTFLKEMKPALDHHYAENRHHPEHFENGIDDMNLIDIIEMLCDWWAATRRHADGDIHKSININTGRFSLFPQLAKILENTVKYMANAEDSLSASDCKKE